MLRRLRADTGDVITAGESTERVDRLTDGALRAPRGYRLNVALAAALGYAYVAAVVAVLIALAAGVVWAAASASPLLVKLLLPIGALAVTVARSLTVRIPRPEGARVGRDEAPELWRLVEGVRERVGGSRVHEIAIIADLNAGVVQQPRLWLFFPRRILIVGWPLLHALSPAELEAVLAHEFAHLAPRDGRLNAFAYRMRASWHRLLEALESDDRSSIVLFRRFFRWYGPFFDSYSFSLARAREYEADRAAARHAGAVTAGRALAALDMCATFLESAYWPQLLSRRHREEAPPADAFSALARALAGARTAADAPDWLRDRLAEPAPLDDVHPSLSQRLAALGVSPDELRDLHSPLARSAADEYLGAALDIELAARLDREWASEVGEHWRASHAHRREQEARLAELDRAAETAQLAADEQCEHALLAAELRGDETARPLLEHAVAAMPDHAPVRFVLGRALIAGGDEAGLDHLERATELDPDAIAPGAEIAYGYLAARDEERAERYRLRVVERLETLERAGAERAQAGISADVRSHDLPAEAVAEVRAALADVGRVRAAYLFRRPMQHLDREYPLYILMVIPEGLRRRVSGDARDAMVAAIARALDLPVQTVVIAPSVIDRAARRAARIPGSRVL
jgi:Zn-dependent protease with chaperone function